MRFKYILAITCLIGIRVVSGEPTAKTYIFAASQYMFQESTLDSLVKYFDVVITHEGQRDYNLMFRDTAQVTWRRDKPPWVLLYKDAMTLIGPGYPFGNPDSTYGGGATVGGFSHFDSIFFGYGSYSPDTFFVMKIAPLTIIIYSI